MENPRQRFYYKLCVTTKGKFYCYMNRSLEFTLGQSLTQDLSSPSPYLYVYKTSELAITNEIAYTSKDFLTKLATKTVLKLMCWGTCIETPRKLAFSNMCVVENLGFHRSDGNQVRETSNLRNIKQGTRREISPRGVKTIRDTSPARIYTSVVARKKSPVFENYLGKVRNKGKVHELLMKMKEETEKLDKEVRDMENWNKFLDIEDVETGHSTQG
jgi:hypothetical protein